MAALRSNREAVGLSQSKLARLSGVSRFKICTYELGDGSLTEDEHNRIEKALRAEVDRLHGIALCADFEQHQPSLGREASGG